MSFLCGSVLGFHLCFLFFWRFSKEPIQLNQCILESQENLTIFIENLLTEMNSKERAQGYPVILQLTFYQNVIIGSDGTKRICSTHSADNQVCLSIFPFIVTPI